ncbi:histidine phosphatase family protein [Nocardioides sp.]|uniref:histidine phosphatase family protein n=1 Tax=Nocardioides sp. TaxID=35761 RepID=UPI002B8AB4C3|nr:histidine phosphatase family protein [Nocardioides sp.]HXH77869.1 histidine phosphatase family protein [Nocardioides sp.]
MTLHLVRHGLPVIDPQCPAAEWELDPAGFDDIWALRESDRLPQRVAWFSSPEPKAQQTAQLLTDGEVGVIEELREHERGVTAWTEDFQDRVLDAFAQPDTSAVPGWEPLAALRERLVPAVRRILDVHGDDDVVMVGHGTAWTLLVAELTGATPDLVRWRSLAMPDVLTVDPALR